MKRWLIFSLLCLSVGLVAKAFAEPAITTGANNNNRLLVKHFVAQSFTAIDINGPINVQIKASQTQPMLELIGSSNSSYLYTTVKNSVLYLGLKPGVQAKISPILVRVSVPQLNQLRYAGSGNVVGEHLNGPLTLVSSGTGAIILSGDNLDLQNLRATNSANIHISGIKSHQLNIDDRSSGKINLDGEMVLNNLYYQGTGPLSVQWINSSKVNVTGSGRGKIFLAGIANELDATLSDHVVMDAKYLHAKKGFINTRENARADVWTKYNLSALATKGSNIYYYHDSQMVGGYMMAPGAVIRMTGLDTINR